MSQQLPPDFQPWEAEGSFPRHAKKKLRPGIKAAIGTLVVLLAVAALIYDQLLCISNVTIIGNRNIPLQEVVEAAGLNGHVSYFAVNEESIRRGIENNRYLIYEGMEKRFPDSVTLYVAERTACATVRTNAASYLLSADGMVLDRTADGQFGDSTVLVTGFQPRDIQVGRIISPNGIGKLDAFSVIMEELTLQGFIGEISELDLSNQDSLYLTTVDGYTVHLGDWSEMRPKIGTVRAVVAKLREMGKKGGIIKASVPGVATYTPEDL